MEVRHDVARRRVQRGGERFEQLTMRAGSILAASLDASAVTVEAD
jgi:hypothetical protein